MISVLSFGFLYLSSRWQIQVTAMALPVLRTRCTGRLHPRVVVLGESEMRAWSSSLSSSSTLFFCKWLDVGSCQLIVEVLKDLKCSGCHLILHKPPFPAGVCATQSTVEKKEGVTQIQWRRRCKAHNKERGRDGWLIVNEIDNAPKNTKFVWNCFHCLQSGVWTWSVIIAGEKGISECDSNLQCPPY